MLLYAWDVVPRSCGKPLLNIFSLLSPECGSPRGETKSGNGFMTPEFQVFEIGGSNSAAGDPSDCYLARPQAKIQCAVGSRLLIELTLKNGFTSTASRCGRARA